MATIRVEGVARLGRNLTLLEQEVFPNAAVRAINRVATTMRGRTAKSVSAFMGVTQKVVRDKIDIRKASKGGHPEARLFIRGTALNLIRFRARQIKAGVSASPWGNRKKFPHAFITRINGVEIVMIRRKRGEGRVGRLPIRPMLGPGIAASANEERFQIEREETVRERMPIELESQISYLVGRMRR